MMKNLLQNMGLASGHEQLEDFLDNASVGIHWVDEPEQLFMRTKPNWLY